MVFPKTLYWFFFFTLYVDNVASILSTNRLFANDTFLLLNNKKLENLHTKLREEITKISMWLIANKLTLNSSTVHVM